MPSWLRSSMTATVSVVLTFWPAMGAPTIQVSHNSVSLESRLVMPVRLNRLARLVPGPEKPGRVLLVVDVRTTRPGMRSSWPVENAPGNGGTLLCTPGPVSWRPLKPASCRFLPRKSISMSTNQPNPLAPALAPRSGAKTSILTGLARCEALAGSVEDPSALAAVVAATAVPTPMIMATAAATTIRGLLTLIHLLLTFLGALHLSSRFCSQRRYFALLCWPSIADPWDVPLRRMAQMRCGQRHDGTVGSS